MPSCHGHMRLLGGECGPTRSEESLACSLNTPLLMRVHGEPDVKRYTCRGAVPNLAAVTCVRRMVRSTCRAVGRCHARPNTVANAEHSRHNMCWPQGPLSHGKAASRLAIMCAGRSSHVASSLGPAYRGYPASRSNTMNLRRRDASDGDMVPSCWRRNSVG